MSEAVWRGRRLGSFSSRVLELSWEGKVGNVGGRGVSYYYGGLGFRYVGIRRECGYSVLELFCFDWR